jgi:hypothetical protein
MEKNMKYSLARTALALAATLTLASCGGGGKATFPINVIVANVMYDGLVLSTNGQDYTVKAPAKNADGTIPNVTFAFPKAIEYGEVYNVVPKTLTSTTTALPAHQSCSAGVAGYPQTATAGQFATINVYYGCTLNAYALTGTIKGLTGTGLVLTNGSTGGSVAPSPTLDATTSLPTGADQTLTMASVGYGFSYGVTVLTQPVGQTCTVTGGANGSGGGIMDATAEAAGGVTNLLVTCVNNS